MKKISILLASLFLLVFTGCDAILDSVYPPENEFLYEGYDDNDYDYGFTVDGLPTYLNSWYDTYDRFYPIIHPNDTNLTIEYVEFKVLDDSNNNAYYNDSSDYIYSSSKDDFYSIYNDAFDNNSSVDGLYDTGLYYDWYGPHYNYFELYLGNLQYLINEGWWSGYDMKIKINVVYTDGTEILETFHVSVY